MSSFVGVEVKLIGVIIFNETYVDDLSDPNSATYQTKAMDVCTQVRAALVCRISKYWHKQITLIQDTLEVFSVLLILSNVNDHYSVALLCCCFFQFLYFLQISKVFDSGNYVHNYTSCTVNNFL